MHPPEGKLTWPTGVATDPHGDIYVVNANASQGASAFHVDIFDPSGHYIANVAVPGAQSIAVDSTGHLYVYRQVSGLEARTVRYDPTVYDPDAGEISYSTTAVVVSEEPADFGNIAVDPSNDHFYIAPGSGSAAISEYAPAVDGVSNQLLTSEIAKGLAFMGQMALDAAHHRIYVVEATGGEPQVKVFDSQPPYALLATIDGSSTPSGAFSSQGVARLELAANESNGHVFVGDIYGAKKIYEFDEDGNYVATIKKTFEVDRAMMSFDNSGESPNQGYLFVPSGASASDGHLFAYEPKLEPKPPVVDSVSVSGLTEGEAVLHAMVNPKGITAHYTLEYVTQQSFEEEGFAAAQVAGEGDLSPTNEAVSVSAPASGLDSGTAYRFRARAENQCLPGGCAGEAQGVFTTFAPYAQSGGCPNQALRTGISAALPDCRAYELVTPSNTGGLAPKAPGIGATLSWSTPPASPSGNSLAYMAVGGVIPGLDGNAAFNGSAYHSIRTASGWKNEGFGPGGPEGAQSDPAALSADHGYLAVSVSELGSLVPDPHATYSYVRYPDGSFHLVGEGSLATQTDVSTNYIAPAGSHIIFESAGSSNPTKQLEPNAPPDGTAAIYDRTADGVLHVVSLLPEEVTPSVAAQYRGASADGSAIAFTLGLGSPFYLRVNDAETLVAAPAAATFAGLSKDGRYLFYLEGGDLYRFDSQTKEEERITTTGDVTPVNVPSEGTGAYFLSPSPLSVGLNPNGEEPTLGAENLYYWDGSAIHFVGTVTERDAEGEAINNQGSIDGLGVWIEALGASAARDSSRTTPDGSALLFESRADLTSFEAGGKAEIYRYNMAEATLECVSCGRIQAKPSSDAVLLKFGFGFGVDNEPLTAASLVPNLSPDSKRAFFQTSERLVPADNDSVTDVYEWEAEGKGSCAETGGCLFLISSGRSSRANYLFGVSESGDDAFIWTADLLTGQDTDETPSVYDVRVNGGFPSTPAPAGECLGEACQPAAAVPNDPTPNSASFRGEGNVAPESTSRCPKGRRRVVRAGKSRCSTRKKSQHKKQHHSKRRTQR